MATIETVSSHSRRSQRNCVYDEFLLTSSIDSLLHFVFQRIYASSSNSSSNFGRQQWPQESYAIYRFKRICNSIRAKFSSCPPFTHRFYSRLLFVSYYSVLSFRPEWLTRSTPINFIFTYYLYYILLLVAFFLFIHWLPFSRIHSMMIMVQMNYVCEADGWRSRRNKDTKNCTTEKEKINNNQRLRNNLLSLSHALVTHTQRISDNLLWMDRMDTGLDFLLS